MGTLVKNRQFELKLVSELLQYPDEEFMKRLPDLEAVVAKLPDEENRNGFEQFIAALQETYTAVFDMNPSTTLNVTYHLWGDGEKRADALARLKELYATAGYELSTGELPDYLPLMLEFLAFCPDARGIDVLWQCLGGLRPLIDRLGKTAPNYAVLLDVLAGSVSDRIGEGVFRPGAGRVDREAAIE